MFRTGSIIWRNAVAADGSFEQPVAWCCFPALVRLAGRGTNTLNDAGRRVVGQIGQYLDNTAKLFDERDDLVDTAQRRQDLRSIFQWIDRPAWAFDPAHAGVAVYPDYQDIAEGFSAAQIGNMPTMENVETTICKHQPAALSAQGT